MHIQPGYTLASVAIPCPFIDHYMMRAVPVYALIYIYGLRLCGAVSIAELSTRFNILESDVVQAWRYWEKEGLVTITGEGDDMCVTFCPVPESGATLAATLPPVVNPATAPPPAQAPAAMPSPQSSTAVPPPQSFIPATERPHYEPEELAMYREKSSEVAGIFAKAEQTLGKLLNYHDMNVLFGLYDWLCMPPRVLEYLLDYCATVEHRNLRYIEKCALDWTERGIRDLEAACAYVQTFERGPRDILRLLGQTTNYPTPSQRKYMDKWLSEWAMPIELVLEACDRSAIELGQPKLKYVDGILSRWHNAGVSTIEGAVRFDAEHATGRTRKSNKATARPRPANFTQRDIDLAQLELLERAYLEELLEE